MNFFLFLIPSLFANIFLPQTSPLPSGSLLEILPSESSLGQITHGGVVGFMVRELFPFPELPPKSPGSGANGLAGLRLVASSVKWGWST